MGGTLARYAAAGEDVAVVTGTRGEVGEIHNRDDADAIRDRLGEVREQELSEALAILGVASPEFLGYRDSGMVGTPDNDHPESFWQADFMEAVGRAVRVIRRQRPEVMTAYDPYGGYGHPDHIQVHRVGTAAFFGAADVGRFPLADGEQAWMPSKLYWSTWPRSRMKERVQRAVANGEIPAEEAEAEPAYGTLDAHITTVIDVTAHVDQKFEAILAHVTQIRADSWVRQMSPDDRLRGFGSETFVRVFSLVDGPAAEPDLFADLR